MEFSKDNSRNDLANKKALNNIFRIKWVEKVKLEKEFFMRFHDQSEDMLLLSLVLIVPQMIQCRLLLTFLTEC